MPRPRDAVARHGAPMHRSLSRAGLELRQARDDRMAAGDARWGGRAPDRPRRSARPRHPTPAPGDPSTVPADHPVVHMTAAFAREQDARFALRILTTSTGQVLSSGLHPVEGAGGRIDVI